MRPTTRASSAANGARAFATAGAISGSGANGVGKQRDELVAKARDLHAAHVEIEPRQKLAVTARCDQQRLADAHGFRQRVVRMRR